MEPLKLARQLGDDTPEVACVGRRGSLEVGAVTTRASDVGRQSGQPSAAALVSLVRSAARSTRSRLTDPQLLQQLVAADVQQVHLVATHPGGVGDLECIA